MNTKIFVIGANEIPAQLKKDTTFNCELTENPYSLRASLQSTIGEKIIVVFLSYLEFRHFEIYDFLQRSVPNVKTFFVVKELSGAMKTKLKTHNNFVVLWKTEEQNLNRDIQAYLNGKKLELRQDRRETHGKNGLLRPTLLPIENSVSEFRPVLGGNLENISLNGTCLKIKSPFYTKKDFVSITYQNIEGEYVTVEGQIRWTKWNQNEQYQELGIQLLAQI